MVDPFAPILAWIESVGDVGLFLIMFADTAMLLHFVPGLAIAGAILLVVATSPARLAVAYVVMSSGSVLGTCALYAAFAYGGRGLADRILRVVPKREWLDRADAQMRSKGALAAIFLLRLVPLLRVYVAIPAGLARVGWRRFLVASIPGILLFNAGFVAAVYGLRSLTRGEAAIALVLAVLAAVAVLAWRRRRARGVSPSSHAAKGGKGGERS